MSNVTENDEGGQMVDLTCDSPSPLKTSPIVTQRSSPLDETNTLTGPSTSPLQVSPPVSRRSSPLEAPSTVTRSSRRKRGRSSAASTGSNDSDDSLLNYHSHRRVVFLDIPPNLANSPDPRYVTATKLLTAKPTPRRSPRLSPQLDITTSPEVSASISSLNSKVGSCSSTSNSSSNGAGGDCFNDSSSSGAIQSRSGVSSSGGSCDKSRILTAGTTISGTSSCSDTGNSTTIPKCLLENSIVVDSNAAEDDIYSLLGGALEECPSHLRRGRLDLGDIVLTSGCQRLVIERKEIKDLAASIKDGRYREQKARMLHGCSGQKRSVDASNDDDDGESDSNGDDEIGLVTTHMYIVETAKSMPWSKIVRIGGLPTATLHAAMLKTAVRDGCPVVQSTGLQHTVSVIDYLFGELCKGGLLFQELEGGQVGAATHYVGTLKKRKRDNLEDPSAVVKAMLAQCPGLSAEKAAALLEVLPSLGALIASREADLAEVKCKGRRIGPAAAKRLYQALHHGE